MKKQKATSSQLLWRWSLYLLGLISCTQLSNGWAKGPVRAAITIHTEQLPSGRALPPIRAAWDDPELLAALQIELLPFLLPQPAPCSVPRDLHALLAQVTKELDYLSLSKAEMLLKQAEEAIHCGEQPVTRPLLARHAYLQVLWALHSKKSASAWLSRFTTLASPGQMPEEQPPFVERAFAQGWTEHAKRVWIHFKPMTLHSTVQLFVNGETWDQESPRYVPPGPVLIQLFRQNGTRLASGWVKVSEANLVYTWPENPSALPSTTILMEALQRSFEAPFTPDVESALRRLAQNSPGKRLAIQVSPPEAPIEQWLVVEGAQAVERLRRVHVPGPEIVSAEVLPKPGPLDALRAPTVGRHVLLASGTLAILGGSFYLQQYLRFDEATVANEAEREAILRRIQVGRVLGLVGLAGVGVGVGMQLTGFPRSSSAPSKQLQVHVYPYFVEPF